jgi:hypothetical protein
MREAIKGSNEISISRTGEHAEKTISLGDAEARREDQKTRKTEYFTTETAKNETLATDGTRI